MLVCNYCGRNLKNEYDTCPGCGSHSFKTISASKEYAIKDAPEDGYKIKTDSFDGQIKVSNILKWIGIILIIFMIIFDIPFLVSGIMTMKDDFGFGIIFILISTLVSLVFVGVGFGLYVYSKKIKKKAKDNIKRVEKLAKTGLLIKNMPYELVNSGIVINNQPIKCILVQYESASGKKIPLKSEPKYSGVLGCEAGTADLLIDPNDFSNYYIDFEIF